jgi:hypothetical protein
LIVVDDPAVFADHAIDDLASESGRRNAANRTLTAGINGLTGRRSDNRDSRRSVTVVQAEIDLAAVDEERFQLDGAACPDGSIAADDDSTAGFDFAANGFAFAVHVRAFPCEPKLAQAHRAATCLQERVCAS